jgi:hypothetical protein
MSKKEKAVECKEVYAPAHWILNEKTWNVRASKKKADPDDPNFDYRAFMENYPYDYIRGEGNDDDNED